MRDSFINVAEADSIPHGHGRTVSVRGREFAVWNLDGQFYCMDDLCPHRGSSLGAGNLSNRVVYCPMHGWGFDVKTGACESRPDRPVKTYPTRVVEGQVQIQIEPFPAPTPPTD